MTIRRAVWIALAMAAVALGGSAALWYIARSAVPDAASGHSLSYLVGLAQPLPVVQQASNWSVLAAVWVTMAIVAWLGFRLASDHGMQDRRGPNVVIAVFAFVGLALTFFSVQLSIDPYYYVEYGRLYGVFGINPYDLAAPLHTADSTLLQLQALLHDPPFPDPYGPGFTLFAGLVAKIESALDARTQLWSWRVIGVACAVATCFAVLRIMRARTPGEQTRGVAAFAFSPVVLYESAVGAHNDLLMVAPAVWAFALVDEYPLFAALLFGVAIAMKYVAIIALPILVLRAARGGKGAASLVAVLSLGLPWLCARPFVMGGAAVRGAATIGSSLSMSLNWLAALPVLHASGGAVPLAPWLPALPLLGAITWPRLVQLALFTLVAAAIVVAAVRYARRPSLETAALPTTAAIWAMPALHPWYVLWLMPFAALRGGWGVYAAWFGAVALLGYAHEGVVPSPLNEALFAALTLVILGLPAAAALRKRGKAS